MSLNNAKHASGVRIVRLLLALAQAGGELTVAKLTDRLEVSRRTLCRYITNLAEVQDVNGRPLVTRDGGYLNPNAVVSLNWWPGLPDTPQPDGDDMLSIFAELRAWGQESGRGGLAA